MKLDLASIVEGLTPAQVGLLHRFETLLRGSGRALGLVSPRDLGRVWERHILDSLRAVACLPNRITVADVGSGGGLPGIPVAIARPECSVILVEAASRKVAFLELAVERLDLANVRVVRGRAESLPVLAQVALARGLGDPLRSWRFASGTIQDGGWLVYFAGRSFELGRARRLVSPARVECGICCPGEFEWQGPLVMMWRSARRSWKGSPIEEQVGEVGVDP